MEPQQDRLRQFYEADGTRALSESTRGVEEWRIDRLVRMARVRAGERVLDAGAGDGRAAERFARAGARVAVLDLAASRLKTVGQRSGPLLRVQGSLPEMPFADGMADLVFCSEVLEHLEDPPAALAEIARVLRPGGRALLAVPNEEAIQQVTCMHCGEHFPLHGHIWRFEKEALCNMVIQAGLTPGRATVFGRSPVLAILNRKPGFPRAALRAVDAMSAWIGLRRGWLVQEATK